MKTKLKAQWQVEWYTDGRQPQEAPDPAYPEGINLVERADASAQCLIPLPYPAPCCGGFLVTCGACGKRVYITAAGRPDDPRSLRMACAPKLAAGERGAHGQVGRSEADAERASASEPTKEAS